MWDIGRRHAGMETDQELSARAFTLHVRLESWYNWKPSSAEQQRDLGLNVLFEYSAGASS